MNKVIVGYDFSRGSACAVDLAIDIANRWQSDLRLVYVNEKRENEENLRSEIERRIAAVGPRLHGIRMEYVIAEGNPSDELTEQAAAVGAQIIVVGTHGMSGKKTNMLGRNSYLTIEKSAVPVLIVRDDFNFNKQLETIVVPIDSSDDTRQKVGTAALFAKSFGSTIHLLGLYSSSSAEVKKIVNNYVKMVSMHLDKMEVQYITKFLDVSKNITADTLSYATAVRADMIAIMTEQEKTLSSLLLGNYAQQMINLSTIPVLTVRPKVVGTKTSTFSI